jgi:hypothetical protein
MLRRQDSSASIVMGYGMDDRGSTPNGDVFSLFHNVQTHFRAHPASYPMRGSFLGGKADVA